MNLTRAAINVEDDLMVFHINDHDGFFDSPYHNERYTDDERPRIDVPTMWSNTYGVHVGNFEDDDTTLYPWHAVLWAEEAR